MDPPNKNTQTPLTPNPNPTQQQSSVPPLGDIDSITEQLKGHGFTDKEIAAIITLSTSTESPKHIQRDERTHGPFLKRGVEVDDSYNALLPQQFYNASSSKRTKLYNFENTSDPNGKKPLNNTIVISGSDDDHHQRKEIPLAFDINAYNIDSSEDDDDETQRNNSLLRIWQRELSKNVAKRYASFIHSVPKKEEEEDDDDDDDVEDEINDGSPTPFSEAMKTIQERVAKSTKKGFIDEFLIWVSKWNGEDLVKRSICVPSLREMSLRILAKNADGIASLDGINDELKQRLSELLCDTRKMNAHFLGLLLAGFPDVIKIKDCSWMIEEEFTKYFGTLDTSILEVLQLDQCGRVITEYTLRSTLAKSPSCLSKLISLSLTGACRLTDKGLQLLVSSATALRSINLSQCSLLTFASLNILADSLGSLLKELYLDDCILIDVSLILSALKRLEHLEVLSLAGLPTVSNKFIKKYMIACGHNIKELVLKDCVNLTDASMKVIAKHCPELHALDITNLNKLTDVTLRYLTNSCQVLLKLKLCRNPFSDEAIAAFLAIHGKSLEELSLNNIKKVGQQTALSLARNAKNLHTLDLSWCRNLTDNEFGLIVDSCSLLRFLRLFGCSQVTNVFLKGHSNSELQIIGLKLCPLLQHIKGPNPHQPVLRYSSDSQ